MDKELFLDGQDLRILKTILNEPTIASEFASTYDEKVFLGDAKKFGKIVLSYIKAYKTAPTKRVLLDRCSNNTELQEEISSVWDAVEATDYDLKEFKYDLDKIKNRFATAKVATLKNMLDDSSSSDLPSILKSAQEQLDDIKRIQKGKRQSYTQKTLKSFIPEFKQSYNDKFHNKELGRGIPTGYSHLDYIKGGMLPAEMMIICAESGVGKALPLDTDIPTPNGFVKMKDIHPGMSIFGKDGNVYTVLAEGDVISAPGWKFIFNDGTEIISHENHEWLSFSLSERLALSRRTDERREKYNIIRRKGRDPKYKRNMDYKKRSLPTGTIRTTKEMVSSLFIRNKRNYSIPLCDSLILPEKNLPIDPYVLGAWLGDGSAGSGTITSADEEIFDYLWSSREQRLAMLQGLMDTYGTVSARGGCVFTNTNKKIADAVVFLLRSLGERCSITESVAKLNGKIIVPVWDVTCSPSIIIFRLPRKVKLQQKSANRLHKSRFIIDAKYVENTEMKCIQVSSPDHLYLAGEQLIPTHNSLLLNNIALQMWLGKNTLSSTTFTKGYNILYFSLEMPYEACVHRTFARLADIPNYGLRDAALNKSQVEALKIATDFVGRYPYEFEIVDIPRGVTVEDLEQRFQEAQNRYNPDIVVVDYLGLLEDPKATGEDWLKLGLISAKLHEFARTYNIVMLTATQLNRASGQKSKQTKEDLVGMHRVGRSALIMHNADIGIQIISRPDEQTFADFKYSIIKHRNGAMGNGTLLKNFANSSIIDIPYTPEESFSTVNGEDVQDISALLNQYNWNKL
jgi:replicative DNA helicase